VRHAYHVLLRLYPEAFRRRYGVEMSLDFADGWAEAAAAGPTAALVFAGRAAGDLVVSLLREWTRGARLAIVAATAGVTLLLWGVALRPWAWNGNIQPGPPRDVPLEEATAAELLVLAAGAMLPVIVVLLFSLRMVKRRELPRRPAQNAGRRPVSGKPA
jgi:hypothetical protein